MREIIEKSQTNELMKLLNENNFKVTEFKVKDDGTFTTTKITIKEPLNFFV